MVEANQSESDAYSRSVELLRTLHHLMTEGLEDSKAADDIREAMEMPWRHLTTAERARVEALSADLYSREVKSQP